MTSYACQNANRTFYYLYFSNYSLMLDCGDSISFSSIECETNVSLDNIYLICDSDILGIQGLNILAKEGGTCHILVYENMTGSLLASLEVKVYLENSNSIKYIIESDSSTCEDNYILSFFINGEPLIEFTFDSSQNVSISKMANTLYISCEKGLIFTVTIRHGTSFVVISLPQQCFL